MTPKKILVLDDEKDLCELIQRILQSSGFEVECAFTLKEGEKKWDKIQPPIVLLDNNFPDGTSLDMLDIHRSLLQNTKVIMITADTFPSTKMRAKELGIHFFIQKPFTLKTIRDLIREIV